MPGPVYAFEGFELDSGEETLRRDGLRIDLDPTPLRLLAYLVARHDRSVPKEELIAGVWPDVVVSDSALSSALKEVRRALGDDGQSQRFIRTQRGRGYRFSCPVSTREAEPAEPAKPAMPRCLAVLPFTNLDGNEGSAYFAEGVTDDIITELTKVRGLFVVSTVSSARFLKTGQSVREIGTALSVASILTGSVRRSADRVRISAQLIQADNEQVLWAQAYDERIDDVLRIQQEVAERIAAELQIELSPEQHRDPALAATRDAGAYDLYLRGRAHYRKWEREENETAIALYKRAIEIDPGFALAYAGLANAYGLRGTNFGFGDEWADAAIEAAERALSLASELPESHKALGLAYHAKGLRRRSLQSYLRAVELRPTYDEAIFNVSQAHFELGEWDEAIGWIKLKIIREPAPNPIEIATYATYLWCLGFRDESGRWFEHALSTSPLLIDANVWVATRELVEGDVRAACERVAALSAAYPHTPECLRIAGRTHLVAGHADRAAALFEEALRVSPGRDTYAMLALGRLEAIAGRAERAETLFGEVEATNRAALERGEDNVSRSWELAAMLAARGERDAALRWFERSVTAGHRLLAWDALEPAFDSIRGEPSFIEQTQRIQRSIATMRERVIREAWHRLDHRVPQLSASA